MSSNPVGIDNAEFNALLRGLTSPQRTLYVPFAALTGAAAGVIV